MKENIKNFFIAWGVLIVLNQITFFHSCFKSYCIASALPHTAFFAFLFIYFVNKEKKKEEATKQDKKGDKSTPSYTKKYKERDENKLKEKGDKYEKFIGDKFEKKGDVVIYNGFMKGYDDKGVDLISLTFNTKEINLIQCKNWTNIPMTIEEIKNIYFKLDSYKNKYLDMNYLEIEKYLQYGNQYNGNLKNEYSYTKENIDSYKRRKILYVGSDQVMSLNLSSSLTMIKENIFRYRDMKVVICEINS